MIIRSVLESAVSVAVAVAPDEGGGEELFVLSPGEWKRLNRSLGYYPEAGSCLSAGQPVDEETYDSLRAAHGRTSAVRSKHTGPRRIAAYLESRGFSRQDAEAAAASVDREDYRAALLWQIRKKCPALETAPETMTAAERGKAMAALMRQGFSADEIRAALREGE